jgi:hypothetical protein
MAFPLVAAIIGSTAIQVIGGLSAAQAQAEEIERQAEQEKFAAEGRELQRQQQLNAALAANAVGIAASGIKTEGSVSSISLESGKQSSLTGGVTGLSDRLAFAQRKRQASNVLSAAPYQAASTLLSGAASAYQASVEYS